MHSHLLLEGKNRTGNRTGMNSCALSRKAESFQGEKRLVGSYARLEVVRKTISNSFLLFPFKKQSVLKERFPPPTGCSVWISHLCLCVFFSELVCASMKLRRLYYFFSLWTNFPATPPHSHITLLYILRRGQQPFFRICTNSLLTLGSLSVFTRGYQHTDKVRLYQRPNFTDKRLLHSFQ